MPSIQENTKKIASYLLIPLVNNAVYVTLKNTTDDDSYVNENAMFFSTVAGVMTMGIVNKLVGATYSTKDFMMAHLEAALMSGGMGGFVNVGASLGKVNTQAGKTLLDYTTNAVTSAGQAFFFWKQADNRKKISEESTPLLQVPYH